MCVYGEYEDNYFIYKLSVFCNIKLQYLLSQGKTCHLYAPIAIWGSAESTVFTFIIFISADNWITGIYTAMSFISTNINYLHFHI